MPASRAATAAFLETCRSLIDNTLAARFVQTPGVSERLLEAMKYSVLGGGKRIRPALCLGAAQALGQPLERAVVPGCTVELIHAYSLIHDDLPAMDDDDLRRGRPTTHIAFDEATAILAGDALQAMAFEWLADAPGIGADTRLMMIQQLTRASGHLGMVGGQAIDLESVGKPITVDALETMHRAKTGALIETSVRLGALTADCVSPRQLDCLSEYAGALGLAFQVQDDLLDIEGDTDVIGKPQGSDLARDKPTYPALLGIEGARAHLKQLLDVALGSLDGFGQEADPLRDMAKFIVARSH